MITKLVVKLLLHFPSALDNWFTCRALLFMFLMEHSSFPSVNKGPPQNLKILAAMYTVTSQSLTGDTD